MLLRDFLYLDRPLVRGFLAQVEGGSVDELTERETSSGSGTIGGRIGAGPVGVSAEKAKDKSLQTEAIVRQVGSSEFDRLYSYLEEDGLQVFDLIPDLDTANSIRRKEFVEIDARFRVSGMHQTLTLIQRVAEAMPLMEQLGTQVGIDEATKRGLVAVSSLSATAVTIPIIASVSGEVGFKAGLELNPDHALVEEWDMDATVLLKVQRVIRGEERHVLGDPFGGLMKFSPPEEQAKLISAFSSAELRKFGVTGDSEITAPGILGTPIAIYR